jgi:ribonuclease BN (tRNA processing enzyme)
MSDGTTPPLQLDIIGAGPAYTDRPGAVGAAYLVRNETSAVVLDLGHGTFARLAGTLEPSAIDAVMISHLHPDHFIDLVALRHYLRWEFAPSRRLRVVGPDGLDGRLDALHAEPGFSAVVLDTEALVDGGRYDVGGLVVAAARIFHTDDSYAFRVARGDDGVGLVYSGDCGRADDLDVLIRPGDALLVEVSFGPGPATPGAAHLDGPAVGRLAARTAAGRVLLTHLQMGFDEGATIDSVRAAYDGPVTIVWPGERYVIGG